ncbi:Lipid-A-disaccharide synthase [hydrothermal vent metagenome]|uniref:lipid-A-disaccharide synthase n=1 Tax=hydrothermal vent metagenome TaxID=652676 RepID=A0A1W1EHT1_9ZZZZ
MKILVSALEPSSNIHLKELLKYSSNIELYGIFSKELGNPLYDISDVAIMGFVDAIKKYKWFKSILKEMVELCSDIDRVLLMDSSGFNIPLSKEIKKHYPNIEIIYYILPQVWASREYRVKKIEKYCDKIFATLPFEVELYSKAQFVGHPLLDEITLRKNSVTNSGIVSFMPGSRRGEIKYLFPIYRELVKILPNLKEAILIVPATFSLEQIDELYGDTSSFIISRDTHKSLYKSDFAFICSGTATLEASLIGTPFILSYIAKKLDYFIAKNILKIKEIGLANIILRHHNNRVLHKELIQSDVNIENLLYEYNNMNREKFLEGTKILKSYLKRGSSKFVGEYISI